MRKGVKYTNNNNNVFVSFFFSVGVIIFQPFFTSSIFFTIKIFINNCGFNRQILLG